MKHLYKTTDLIQSLTTVVFLTLFMVNATAQLPRYYQEEAKNNEGTVLTANILFGAHLPAGDLSDRFGSYLSTGLGVDLITNDDWVFGGQWNFNFGTKVKEDVISTVRGDDGLIFGENGDIASSIALRLRGMYLGAHLGKIFRLNAKKRSGIRTTVGAGFFQHKVRIQDDPVVLVPQLNKTYKRGYDRLTNGVGITEFIGYQHLGPLRRANFIIGIELTQAFTQNRRNFNYDTRSQDSGSRLDLSYGFRLGWQLPFYLGESAEDIRY